MSALGRHVLAEFYGCPREILNDVKRIERTMVDAALEAGAEIREVAFHKFSPGRKWCCCDFRVASGDSHLA